MKNDSKFYRFWKRLLNGMLLISLLYACIGLPMYAAEEAAKRPVPCSHFGNFQ